MEHIINASDEVVRKALIAICADSSIERQAVDVIKQLEEHIKAASGDVAASTSVSDATKKRKAPNDVHICVQCKETFTEEENSSEECQYHPGELEEGEDFWMDCFDGDPTYTVEEMFADCPDRVDWNCCQKNGEAEGCAFDWHRSYLTIGKARTD